MHKNVAKYVSLTKARHRQLCLEIIDNLEITNYEGESNINGNFAVDCTKHVRT